MEREIRLLKAYALASAFALVFLTVTAIRQAPPARPRFDEITVERINVVEKDGRVRLVIANSARQAVTVVDGKQILPARQRQAGFIFSMTKATRTAGSPTAAGARRTSRTPAPGCRSISTNRTKRSRSATCRMAASARRG